MRTLKKLTRCSYELFGLEFELLRLLEFELHEDEEEDGEYDQKFWGLFRQLYGKYGLNDGDKEDDKLENCKGEDEDGDADADDEDALENDEEEGDEEEYDDGDADADDDEDKQGDELENDEEVRLLGLLEHGSPIKTLSMS
ncbi:hypothetical protein AGMMS49531_10720 [Endomicrobiia bacterium]|nr:hypothetical protein AGMMS49531_10720 [Endomicrobiia bacterium]